MISQLPSYDDELLNSAYANISLIADEAWAFDPEDSFRKLNHSLWIQSCEVIAKYKENSDYSPKLVRDVISESRLAKYGNYEYNEQHENMYKPDDDKLSGSRLCHFHSGAEATEPWMLSEVQKHFARLISPSCTRLYREPSAISILKCNSLKKESESANVCTNFQSDLNESGKKQNENFNPKENRKFELHSKSVSTHSSHEDGPREKSGKSVAYHRRYVVETIAEIKLQSRIESVRDIWNPEKFHQQRQNQQSRVNRTQTWPHAAHQNQQLYCTLQYQPLILRSEYQSKSLQSPQPTTPVLSAEVPEFFPKSNPPPIVYGLNGEKERRACQIRYFPLLNDRNYQNELFPYSRLQHETATTTVFPNARMSILPAANVFRSSQEWIHRVTSSPMQLQLAATSSPTLQICTSLQPVHDAAAVPAYRPLQIYEKCLSYTQPNPMTPIPVYQRPMELYQEPVPKRKSHGVDFNNLILLTKNKTRRNVHSKSINVQQPCLLKSKQNLRTSSGHNVQVRLLNKDHRATKTKEIVAVNALMSELHNFEEKYERGRGASWKTVSNSFQSQQRPLETLRSEKDGIFGSKSSRYKILNAEEKNKRTRRPLYRDVVANTSSEEVVSDNVFEKRYDELEQQAIEQYRNSEESLALKYQELERQAMEQYGNSNTADEKHSTSSDEQYCFDGQQCSGYGQCSPSRKRTKWKGSCFPQIALLKPKGKSLPNVFHGSSYDDSNQHSAIVSRSLSALNDRSLKESKNICKGASGDKIDTSVQTLSKRHLILMSPFERRSDARRMMKATDLREICSISRAKKNVLDYYRDSEIVQNGSGDENITILQSPNTEGRRDIFIFFLSFLPSPFIS
ncbi:uncharacterized protein LOC109859646 isoform X2 [Pseudomyrmex gracilis]|uniref:uncharacterized protein LOC109859646 isoform X2 n=1 Tax=Pseudomyrmex gracilis TaxID=219809 RepID=UPI0009948F23|nr:uncharacterized protein LOC109859646 isoform X2 [Pseudomyrmex gracilis]